MKKNIESILNKQVNNEYYSSYLYLSMAAYFESTNLSGLAHWMKKQSQEELVHTMKIFDHLVNRDARVQLMKIDAPQLKWKSPLDAFQNALKHEKLVSSQINKIFGLAKKEKEHPTEILMHWFIEEQVEEEDSANKIVEQLKLIGSSKNGLLMLDKELAKRE